MPIKVQTPTQAQIDELRNRFLEKYQNQPPKVPFHKNDMDRVKNEDLWCTRFLEMYDLDMKVSLEKLWETCMWRKEFGANDLSEHNVRREYLLDGVVFPHNKDVDGKPLLIFRTKLHNKGTKNMDEVMRVVVYWIERIHRETNMQKITIFFDMDGTGLSSMDLDFVKRIIETFKLYYPNALNYILVYEMAWVLNAAFKIVKGLLPAKALEILKMITKKDINTYIDKNNCLKSWGGNDDYAYSFAPEKTIQPATSTTAEVIPSGRANGTLPSPTENGIHSNNIELNDSNNNHHDKKVHFANSSPFRWTGAGEDTEEYHMPSDQNMLHINPSEFLTFPQGESSDTVVEITCTSKFPVMYKIQTTSPEKFRVRPRCGVLKPNQSVQVNILLKAEHRLSEPSKDKFLVMCMPTPGEMDMSPPLISEVWKQKQANSSDVEQHRLCCIYKNEPVRGSYGGNVSQQGTDIADSRSTGNITELAKHAKKLEKQLKFTQVLQYVTLFVLLIMSVAVVYLLRLEMDSGSFQPPVSSLKRQ